MESKFKTGLANQVMAEFDNVKNLRLDFINSGASKELVSELEEIMTNLFSAYLDLTKPEE